MARRNAPPASGPSYVPHPNRRAALGPGDDEDRSAFSRFVETHISAPDKLPGNLNLLVGVSMFVGGIFAVRTWGELMVPA